MCMGLSSPVRGRSSQQWETVAGTVAGAGTLGNSELEQGGV